VRRKNNFIRFFALLSPGNGNEKVIFKFFFSGGLLLHQVVQCSYSKETIQALSFTIIMPSQSNRLAIKKKLTR